MLQELSMVEQRYLAVREVLDSGAAITEVATRYGVNRRTLHRWLLCLRGPGCPCRSQLAPRHLSPPDRRRGRGPHRGATPWPSGVGSPHDPEPAATSARGAALALGDLA